MAFDPNELNSENTPMRWRLQGKRIADGGAEGAAEAAKLDDVYEAVLTRAATFTSDEELGIGNQPGVGGPAEPEPTPEPVLVSSITITGAPGDLELGTDTEAQLGVDVLPVDADNSAVSWSSDDETVVTVNGSGLVSVVGTGTANVSATAVDGSGVSDSVAITVVDLV